MRIKFLIVLGAATLFVSGGMLVARPVGAQTPASVTTKNGILVQEVKVGGSCVVLATYSGPDRPANEVAMVPCRP
jgi:hypothetical protein